MPNAANDHVCDPHDNLSRLTLLIVDPNARSRDFIAEVAGELGAGRVVSEVTAEAAMARIADGGVDIVLIDCLPGMLDGIQFARQVRHGFTDQRRRTAIGVFLPTATIGRIREARDNGVNVVILKPLTVRGLSTKLLQLASPPRAFIEAPNYVGPDRRIGASPSHRGPWRRRDDPRRPAAV